MQRTDEYGRPFGVWDFVCDVEGQIFRAGYCHGWQEITFEFIERRYGEYYIEEMIEEQELRRLFEWKYHTNGHLSQLDAAICFREYLLDQYFRIVLPREGSTLTDRICEYPGCGDAAHGEVHLFPTPHVYSLCGRHLNRDGVSPLFDAKSLCDTKLHIFF